MKAFRQIIDNRQRPRDASVIAGQNHEASLNICTTEAAEFAMQNLCTADVTGESGARASLAIKDAVAPRAPLRMARLLMDMSKERGFTRRIG